MASASDPAEPVERTAIADEMDTVLAAFRHLVASANVTGLSRRSNGTRWTNEQLLYHMLFGYMVVRALLVLVKIFGRLPAGASRAFATGLDRATGPFNVINYWGSVGGAKVFNAKRMANKCDRAIGSLQRHLERETERELRRHALSDRLGPVLQAVHDSRGHLPLPNAALQLPPRTTQPVNE